MSPDSDGEKRTVGCALSRLIIHEHHLIKIKDAVLSTHKATILVSELLNLHMGEQILGVRHKHYPLGI